jgi:hypothetical protein
MKIAATRRFLILLLLCCLACPASAKEVTLSDRAQKIRAKFIELRNNPDNTNLWEEYLKMLPRSKTDFKRIFDPDDFSELYNNSHEYIFIFNGAPQVKRKEVFELVVSITKEGSPGCCDAWSALHSVAVTYALQDTRSFASLLKSLKTQEMKNIVKFLADVENHRVFKDYQTIIDNLKKLNEQELAKKFERARALRMKAKH